MTEEEGVAVRQRLSAGSHQVGRKFWRSDKDGRSYGEGRSAASISTRQWLYWTWPKVVSVDGEFKRDPV